MTAHPAAEAEGAARPVTHRRILHIAVPIVISNATVPILGAVDTGVVGQLGDPVPIGAVGIGAIILTSIYWLFGFLRMGTVGLTSQAEGAGDTAEVSALLVRALLIAGAGGALLILAQWLLFAGAFALSPASAEVEAAARSYMAIRIWSAPGAIAVYGITGWLIAKERTRGVLVVQLWMNLTNIALDLLFVLVLDWGVNGVAVATFIAEWSGAAVGLWLCRDGFGGGHWKNRALIFDPARLLHMANVNTNILLRTLMLEAIFVSFLFLGARFGDVKLAANQILLQLLFITAYALDGFAFSAEVFVGQAYGRKSPAAVRRGAVMTSLWGFGTGGALGLVFLAFGPLIIDVMTTAPGVREAARGHLFWMVLAPFVGAASWMFDGIYIGATRSRDMRDMMFLSLLCYLVALAVLVPWLGNHGVWAALLVSFAARGVFMGWRYPALERDAAA
ncbi:MATE family efflux transporter [Oceanicola sp. 502str15]|uniref:MATE family efflux transporter n=1 Tax=Oceanicola sp. 502str15 TaxID=2696061 RepID=UPI002094DA6E|nr:MATE family efflux transporter [Oceanicola sp. 502str15]MCO6383609.1 MATE family efflux transporter [Oceanicola sp. 502str15]